MLDRIKSAPEASLCDILVIGGGPAGSTAATVLADRGYKVVLLEKDQHPRFHIGESLLPFNLPLFEKLGVKEKVASIGVIKYGAEFVSPFQDSTTTFQFAGALDDRQPFAYQVRRSEFDEMLLRNSQAHGVEVYERTRALSADLDRDDGVRVTARDETGTETVWHAKFLVDASGRDTLLSNQLGIKRRSKKHNAAAIFGHFTGAHRNEGRAHGNISIFFFPHGWFWFIPLHDGTTSVGAVCKPQYFKTRTGDLKQFYFDTIALCPKLAHRLRDAKLEGGVTGTGNYSYKSDSMLGRRHILIGDAFAFIDPMFSTGVYVAMSSAFMGADVVDAALKEPAKYAAAQHKFDRKIRSALSLFSWYIHRMNMPTMRRMFMGPRNFFKIEQAMLSLLAGDVYVNPTIRIRLAVFKLIYYFMSARSLPETWEAVRTRLAGIRTNVTETN
ncbi:NAD(P)/FAD-dependent oxidoreductase [Roseiterribacter gracilis]|uniref:Hydroxylase n=1 Tax=Roseiterribacter gracilis TaxID=2812848 RepID=A0A8S8X8M5_9PROT|nr:hydroxylase [Rhodospirillales bacterium TMPK1]